MAGVEPQAKRSKDSLYKENIFSFFHQHSLHELKGALSSLREPISGYGVAVSKISFCDAKTDKSFRNSTCKCNQLRRDDNLYPKGYTVINIFQQGIDLIEAYIRSPQCVPERKGAKLALSKLLTFLLQKDCIEEAVRDLTADVAKTKLTVPVVHHLLSKLTVLSTYILDKESTEKIDCICTCGCDEKLTGAYGDTSLGVHSYWHGRFDILMDAAVEIIATDESDSEDAGNCSARNIMAAHRDQIRAKSIVFSFLTSKNHPELDNFLIPTIVLSQTHVAVCMYDCENDILLETPLLSLFQQGNNKILCKSTILILWLALNYKYCCSGVPKEIIDIGYTADFEKHTGPDVLEKYINDVIAPCDYVAKYDWFVLPVVEMLPVEKK